MGNCLAPVPSGKKEFIGSKASKTELKAQYDIDTHKVLGSGSYGKVFMAKSKKDSSMKIAIKVINK